MGFVGFCIGEGEISEVYWASPSSSADDSLSELRLDIGPSTGFGSFLGRPFNKGADYSLWQDFARTDQKV